MMTVSNPYIFISKISVYILVICPRYSNSLLDTKLQNDLPTKKELNVMLDQIEGKIHHFEKIFENLIELELGSNKKGLKDRLSWITTKEGFDALETEDGQKKEDNKASGKNQTDNSSWAKLQMSPTAIGSVPYMDFRVNIYEHSANRRNTEATKNNTNLINRYYYAPIALLDARNLHFFQNKITGQIEMDFGIELWNDEIQMQVTEWIKREIDTTVKENFVQILPFKELILTSSPVFRRKYRFSSETWLPYQQQKTVRFSLLCGSLEESKTLADYMQNQPHFFASFRLQFRVDSDLSQTKQTVVHVDSIMNGNLMSELNQKMANEEFALLGENDKQQLLSESVMNIQIDTMDDSDIISPNSQDQLMKFLQDNMIEPTKIMIKEQSDRLWNNVFFNSDNYRPDVLTSAFNNISSNLSTTDQQKLANAFKNTDKVGGGGSLGVPGIFEVSLHASKETGREANNSTESLDTFLQRSKDNILWDGQKFIPKPMSLSRVNLAKLRVSKTFEDRKVHIRYSTATLSHPVNIPLFTDVNSTKHILKMKKQFNELAATCEAAKTELESTDNAINSLSAILDTGGFKYRMRYLNDEIDILYKGLSKLTTLTIFDVFRQTDIKVFERNSIDGIVITFDGISVLEGESMNQNTGIFTTPFKGIYKFRFHGTANDNQNIAVQVTLTVNGVAKAVTRADSFPQHSLALTVILNLNTGDEVACLFYRGRIISHAHFTGQLLYTL